MRVISSLSILVFLSTALLAPSRADAQCRTIIVRGPRVRVIAPCLVPRAPVVVQVVPGQPPPPPYWAGQPAPVYAPPPPPPPPPAPPAPPPPVMVQPAPAYSPPPPVPTHYRSFVRPQLFTLGMFAEGALYKKGGMGGAAFYAQLRMGRAWHLFGSLGANGSCTNCNADDPNRIDLKGTLGLQYYFMENSRFAPYLRGSLVYQSVSFKDPNDPEADALARTSQLGGELAAGLEWRALRWLVLGADVAYVGLKRLGDDQEGAIPADMGKGVPAVNSFDHGATFRMSIALRF